jgi:type I restriction enzyme R subunit
MSPSYSRSERKTQNRVASLCTDASRPDCLGYDHLGEWIERDNNRFIEVDFFCEVTSRSVVALKRTFSTALQKLLIAADFTGITFYQANLRT